MRDRYHSNAFKVHKSIELTVMQLSHSLMVSISENFQGSSSDQEKNNTDKWKFDGFNDCTLLRTLRFSNFFQSFIITVLGCLNGKAYTD